MTEPQWRELSPGEVLLALQHIHDRGGQPASGFLDVHQWSALAPSADQQQAYPHAEAQFRRIGLNVLPAVTLLMLPLAQLPPHQRGARALRRLLEHTAANSAAIGEIAVLGDQAYIAATGSVLIDAAGNELSTVSLAAWPEAAPAIQSSSVPALRLDAVIARLFNVSRSEAEIAITHGFVFVNFVAADKPARKLAVGANLVFRGKGRVKLLSALPNQRSGRVNVGYISWPA